MWFIRQLIQVKRLITRCTKTFRPSPLKGLRVKDDHCLESGGEGPEDLKTTLHIARPAMGTETRRRLAGRIISSPGITQ